MNRKGSAGLYPRSKFDTEALKPADLINLRDNCKLLVDKVLGPASRCCAAKPLHSATSPLAMLQAPQKRVGAFPKSRRTTPREP